MNKNKKGFTLTELIIVIVIIGILAAVLIPSLTGYVRKARISNDNTDAAQMTKLMSLYMVENEITECDIHVLRASLAGTEYENADAKVDGYSFWLNTEEKYVFLSKTDDAIAGNVVVDATAPSNIIVPEAISSNGSFLYIDHENSVYNQAINTLYDMAKGLKSKTDFTVSFASLSNTSTPYTYFNQIASKLDSTLLVSDSWMVIPTDNEGTAGVDESIIKTVLFTPYIKTIPTNVLDSMMNFEKGSNGETFKLVLPNTVEEIKNRAFQYTNELMLINPSKASLNSNNTNSLIEIVKGSQSSNVEMPLYTLTGQWNGYVTQTLSNNKVNTSITNGSCDKTTKEFEYKNISLTIGNETFTKQTDQIKQYMNYVPIVSGTNLNSVVKSVKLDMKQMNGQTYYIAYAFDEYGRIIAKSKTVGYFTEVAKSIKHNADTTCSATVVLPVSKLNNISLSNIKVYINNSPLTLSNSVFKITNLAKATAVDGVETYQIVVKEVQADENKTEKIIYVENALIKN